MYQCGHLGHEANMFWVVKSGQNAMPTRNQSQVGPIRPYAMMQELKFVMVCLLTLRLQLWHLRILAPQHLLIVHAVCGCVCVCISCEMLDSHVKCLQTGAKNSTQANMHVAYPLVVIHQATPVQHVHHGLEAEDGLLVQLVIVRHSQVPSSQFDWLVSFSPGKLLLPCLQQADVWTGSYAM